MGWRCVLNARICTSAPLASLESDETVSWSRAQWRSSNARSVWGMLGLDQRPLINARACIASRERRRGSEIEGIPCEEHRVLGRWDTIKSPSVNAWLCTALREERRGSEVEGISREEHRELP